MNVENCFLGCDGSAGVAGARQNSQYFPPPTPSSTSSPWIRLILSSIPSFLQLSPPPSVRQCPAMLMNIEKCLGRMWWIGWWCWCPPGAASTSPPPTPSSTSSPWSRLILGFILSIFTAIATALSPPVPSYVVEYREMLSRMWWIGWWCWCPPGAASTSPPPTPSSTSSPWSRLILGFILSIFTAIATALSPLVPSYVDEYREMLSRMWWIGWWCWCPPGTASTSPPPTPSSTSSPSSSSPPRGTKAPPFQKPLPGYLLVNWRVVSSTGTIRHLGV